MPETANPYALLESSVLPLVKLHNDTVIAACPHPENGPRSVWGFVCRTLLGVERWTIDGHNYRSIDSRAWPQGPYHTL